MKLIHCSDLHLDSSLGSNLTTEKSKIRNAELRATFARLVQYAVREAVDAVLICGDLFDSPYVSLLTSNFVLEQIRNAQQVQFFYLRGNHDEKRDVFAGMEQPENFKTFGSDWESVRCQDAVITAIEPEGGIWLTMYDQLKLNPDEMNIVMLHGQVATQPGEEQIALPLLKNKHIRYLALGHLHSYQKAQLDFDGEYCYSGCIEGRGFDECGEKGFVLLETEGKKLKSRFVPFASRKLHEVSVDISGLDTASQILAAARRSAADISAEDLVKFVLSGSCTLQTQKDIRFLQKMLEQEFWYVTIRDESRLAIEPQSFAYDISLKGEFIRAVMASDCTEEEKTRIISCGIRALSGEEVLL